jgi:hypothetical protein
MKRLVDLNDEERALRQDHWEQLGAAVRADLDSLPGCGRE